MVLLSGVSHAAVLRLLHAADPQGTFDVELPFDGSAGVRLTSGIPLEPTALSAWLARLNEGPAASAPDGKTKAHQECSPSTSSLPSAGGQGKKATAVGPASSSHPVQTGDAPRPPAEAPLAHVATAPRAVKLELPAPMQGIAGAGQGGDKEDVKPSLRSLAQPPHPPFVNAEAGPSRPRRPSTAFVAQAVITHPDALERSVEDLLDEAAARSGSSHERPSPLEPPPSTPPPQQTQATAGEDDEEGEQGRPEWSTQSAEDRFGVKRKANASPPRTSKYARTSIDESAGTQERAEQSEVDELEASEDETDKVETLLLRKGDAKGKGKAPMVRESPRKKSGGSKKTSATAQTPQQIARDNPFSPVYEGAVERHVQSQLSNARQLSTDKVARNLISFIAQWPVPDEVRRQVGEGPARIELLRHAFFYVIDLRHALITLTNVSRQLVAILEAADLPVARDIAPDFRLILRSCLREVIISSFREDYERHLPVLRALWTYEGTSSVRRLLDLHVERFTAMPFPEVADVLILSGILSYKTYRWDAIALDQAFATVERMWLSRTDLPQQVVQALDARILQRRRPLPVDEVKQDRALPAKSPVKQAVLRPSGVAQAAAAPQVATRVPAPPVLEPSAAAPVPSHTILQPTPSSLPAPVPPHVPLAVPPSASVLASPPAPPSTSTPANPPTAAASVADASSYSRSAAFDSLFPPPHVPPSAPEPTPNTAPVAPPLRLPPPPPPAAAAAAFRRSSDTNDAPPPSTAPAALGRPSLPAASARPLAPSPHEAKPVIPRHPAPYSSPLKKPAVAATGGEDDAIVLDSSDDEGPAPKQKHQDAHLGYTRVLDKCETSSMSLKAAAEALRAETRKLGTRPLVDFLLEKQHVYLQRDANAVDLLLRLTTKYGQPPSDTPSQVPLDPAALKEKTFRQTLRKHIHESICTATDRAYRERLPLLRAYVQWEAHHQGTVARHVREHIRRLRTRQPRTQGDYRLLTELLTPVDFYNKPEHVTDVAKYLGEVKENNPTSRELLENLRFAFKPQG